MLAIETVAYRRREEAICDAAGKYPRSISDTSCGADLLLLGYGTIPEPAASTGKSNLPAPSNMRHRR
jgi:hypothetical protein